MKSRSVEIGLLALIAAACLLHPYYYGVSDHTYKVAFLKAAYDPTLFVPDIAIQMRHLYVSLFPLLMRPFVAGLGFEGADFAVYWLTRIAFLGLTYLVAKQLTGDKLAALLAVVMLWLPRVVMGGISTFDVILQERGVAFVVALLGVYLLLKDRPVWAGLAAGVCGCLHFVTAANLGLFIGLLWTLEWIAAPTRSIVIRRALWFLAAFVAGLTPLVVKALTGGGSPNLLGLMDPAWLQIIAVRSAHHHDAAGMLPIFWSHLVFGLLIVLGLLVSTPGAADLDLRLRRWYWAALASLPLGWTLGWLVMGPLPWHFGMMMSTFRVDHLLTVLTYIAAAFLLLKLPLPRHLSFVLGCAFAVCRVRYQLVLLGLCVAIWLYDSGSRVVPRFARRATRLPESFVALRWGVAAAFLAAALASFPFPALGMAMFTDVEPRNRQLQDWMKQNVPRDALILVPPLPDDEFRVFSERSMFGSWKDWTFAELDRTFAFEMAERLERAYGITWASGTAGAERYYSGLTERQLLDLAGRYRITHIVRLAADPLGLPLAYANGRFLLYRVP